MTEEFTPDKSGAPPCGLYMRISHNPDMDHWTPLMGALSTATKYRSGYAKNRLALEITLEDNFTREAMEKAAAFVQIAQISGFVSILKSTAQLAKDMEADGVILSNPQEIAPARALLGEDAIIGLACGQDSAAITAAIQEGADYITIGTGATIPTPAFLENALREKSNLTVAALGPFKPDTAPFYAQGGATFIDGTYYIGSHDDGAMQAAVNLLHAVKIS